MTTVRPREGLGAVLFDLDGTLVDSLPTIARAMAAACREHGYEVDPEKVIPLIGAPMADLAGNVTGAPREVAEAINEVYLRIYHDQYIAETPPIEGATDLVQALYATGVPLGVVTNKNHAGGLRMVEVQGWQSYFATIVGRDTAAKPKPAADPVLHALAELGVEPSRSALVGDTEFDMGCGHAAGLARVIGIADSRSPQQLIDSGATDVVGSLAEVERLLLDGVAAR
jgi:HAD superfamily hydrolase (TIGR01509 family)